MLCLPYNLDTIMKSSITFLLIISGCEFQFGLSAGKIRS